MARIKKPKEPKPEIKYSAAYTSFIERRVKSPLHALENFKIGVIKKSDIPKFLWEEHLKNLKKTKK